MANFIWDDNETQKLLVQFGGDYIAAQHKLEVLEFGAGAATDIAIDAVITALTAGMGLAIVAGTKLHYLDKFKKLGPLFKKLAELRKKLFKRKKKAGQTGGEIPEQLGKPEVVESPSTRRTLHKDKDEITRLSKAGDIAGARKVLQPYLEKAKNANNPIGKKEAMDAIIDRLDVSSEKEKVFWSGNKTLAGDYASKNGKTILEQTPGGSVIDGWDDLNDTFSWNKNNMAPHGWDLWGNVSSKYADGAIGNIETIQTLEKYPAGGPTWKSKEWPSLFSNPEVGDITIHKIDESGNILESKTMFSKSDEAISIFGSPQ